MCCEAPLRLCVYDVMFLKKFSPKGPPFNFLMICDGLDIEKSQRVPYFFCDVRFLIFFHRRVLPSICLMICDRMDEKSQSVASGVPIRFNFWVFRVLWKRILSHFEVLLLFLVGAFSFKEKSPTITVASFLFFFVRPQSSSRMYHFLQKLISSLRPSSTNANLLQRVPPFVFYLFYVTYKTGRLQRVPFNFFSALCEFFFENF